MDEGEAVEDLRRVAVSQNTEYRRGASELEEQSMSRRMLTSRIKHLSEVLDKYHESEEEEVEPDSMSNVFERKICKECNGHGTIEDETCPECGGTGITEPIDDRIHPRGREVPASPTVLKESR